ncbi:MAG: hypothetical protein R6X32_17125, partial [Chloroflexota bacterium]
PAYRIDALAIFCLFLAVYLFSFKGLFTAIDELGLYARTESLVQWGHLNVPQLRFATWHNPVGSQEIGFSLLAAPFYWLAYQIPALNRIHTVMLINPLATAVTAVTLYLTSHRLGYGRTASLLAVFTFGLASLAWPYAQTFYRESVVALGWSLGLYGLVRWHTGGHLYWAGLSLLVLALTVLVKATAFIAIPCLLLPFMAVRLRRRHFLGALLLVSVAALLLFMLVAAERYGSVAATLRRIANQDLLLMGHRVYGQLLSPGKGLVFYTPAILVALGGLIPLWRRQRAVAVAIGVTMLTLAAAYATYNSWYGGLSWGPRFLVPALPLLLLAVAPAWEATAVTGYKKHLFRLMIGMLLLASLIIQLAVVTADWWPGYKPLFTAAPDAVNTVGLDLTRLDLSPPLVQTAVWQPEFLNLLWLHQTPSVGVTLARRLGGVLAAGVAGTLLLWWGVGRRQYLWPLLPLPLLLALFGLLRWGPAVIADLETITAGQGRAIAAWVSEVPTDPYILVTASNNFGNYFYLGYLQGQFRHYWYSPAQQSDFGITAVDAQWLSLVVDRVHMSPEHSGKEIEWWLNDQFYRIDSDWVGQYELIRYANFDQTDWTWRTLDLRFGEGLAVEQVGVSQSQLPAGQAIGVEMEIRRVGPLPDYHNLFVHLLKSDFSHQVNGLDGPVKYGYSLAVPWEMGAAYTEKRAIYIPQATPAGTYDLIVGFETPTGTLTAVPPANDAATYAVLGQITIIDSP